ncbi:Reverse transcriptase (RNA-dependent DNA polymerase) [Fragilaria crotonensis]|nr:Reverse transcriptase (RNA-dependent DNA polymerase) [Fragilaria crotonensis]
MRAFKECDWRAFYGNAKEALPPNAPTPRGKDVDLRLFVDSDHAGDKKTRRSRTGFLIYLNSAPITWFSKKQSTIETSVFGAEFVAMKQGMETLRGLRYKLRMMGVSLSGPSYIYGDNMSVVHNTQRPESTLKKSNSVCYHAVREAVAMGECLVGHVSTHDNPADICTKIIPGGQKRDHLVGLILRYHRPQVIPLIEVRRFLGFLAAPFLGAS